MLAYTRCKTLHYWTRDVEGKLDAAEITGRCGGPCTGRMLDMNLDWRDSTRDAGELENNGRSTA